LDGALAALATARAAAGAALAGTAGLAEERGPVRAGLAEPVEVRLEDDGVDADLARVGRGRERGADGEARRLRGHAGVGVEHVRADGLRAGVLDDEVVLALAEVEAGPRED